MIDGTPSGRVCGDRSSTSRGVMCYNIPERDSQEWGYFSLRFHPPASPPSSLRLEMVEGSRIHMAIQQSD